MENVGTRWRKSLLSRRFPGTFNSAAARESGLTLLYEGAHPLGVVRVKARLTLEFALESRLEIANFNPLTPMPGSALYARLLSEGRLLSPQWWLDPDYRYGDAVFEPRGMRAHELSEGVFEARRRFYRWSAIGRRLIGASSLGLTIIANVISRREIYKKQRRRLGA